MPELVRLKGRVWTSELREKYGPARGWLTDEQVALIVEELKDRSLTMYDIADRWLVCRSTISTIAANHGAKRQISHMSRKLSDEQQQSLLREIEEGGKSYSVLAEQYRLNAQQVGNFARGHGVRRPPKRMLDVVLSPDQREQLLTLARVSDASYNDIAKRFNVTAGQTNKYAIAMGVRRGHGRRPLTKRQQLCR